MQSVDTPESATLKQKKFSWLEPSLLALLALMGFLIISFCGFFIYFFSDPILLKPNTVQKSSSGLQATQNADKLFDLLNTHPKLDFYQTPEPQNNQAIKPNNSS